MELLWFILIGLAAGWLAGQLMKSGGFGIDGDIIVGVIGALWAVFSSAPWGFPPVVKLLADRQQTVIDSEVCGVVLHPMYAGAVPVCLVSWSGISSRSQRCWLVDCFWTESADELLARRNQI